MAWTYNAKSRRYHNDKTGRFLSNSQMVGLRDQFSERQKARTDALAESMAEGNLTAQQWVYGMRKQITTSFVDQYALGRGGRNAMTEDDWSTVEGLLKNQYQYLNGFASDIVGGELSLARIKQRAAMYMDASTQVYERGRAIAFGLPELPAYPGDGQTECKCITTPWSRVLTKRGWIPISDVTVGDYVWTHRERWRKVLHTIVSSSNSNHRQSWIKGFSGEWIGCTSDHKWMTPLGWADSIIIDSLRLPVYIGPYEQNMRLLRLCSREPQQKRQMYDMPIGLCLRATEGLSSRRVHLLRYEPQGQDSVGGQGNPLQDGEVASGGSRRAAHALERPRNGQLANQGKRWKGIRLVLDRGRRAQDGLPLSMDMDQSQWSDSRRLRNSSYRSRLHERRSLQPGVDDQWRSCPLTWEDCQGGIVRQTQNELRSLWQGVPETPSRETDRRRQVLLAGMLPLGTALYDISVEEDHSFIVEGMVSHNSNCKCRWIYDVTEETIDCYWTLGGAEHCPGCVENAAQWNPLSFDTETKNITIKEEVSKDEGEESADYVPFVRKGDFGDYYKNELGINNVVDLDTMRIDDINMITKTLYDLKYQGAKLPDKFEVHDQVWFDNKGHEHSHAFYDVSFDKIAINRDSTFWKDNAAGRTSTFETYIRTNFLSVSDSSDHAYLLRHELGHANHGGDVHVRWEKLPEKMLEDVGGELSHYGKVSKGEFVAETFAGMTGGRTYSAQLMDYYKEYGGKVL